MARALRFSGMQERSRRRRTLLAQKAHTRLPEGAEFQMMYRGFGGYGYHMLGPGFSWLIGLVFWLLFIAAIVMFVMMLVRMARRGTMGDHMGHMGGHHWMMGAGPEDPAAIVKRRLAGGEITPEQYEEIMGKLRV